MHRDEGAHRAAPPVKPRRSLARLVALVAGLFALLAFLAPIASAGGPRISGATEWDGEPPAEAREGPVLESTPHATAEPEPASPIIGTSDAVGWGTKVARRILAGGITWNRVELGTHTPNTLRSSLKDGFKVLAIVGNTRDSAPLSGVDPRQWGAWVASELRENRGISIAEAGNESYLKGGLANPVQYGRMYLAAVEAMSSARIDTRLLFNMTGDYPLGSWSDPHGWSRDARGGGWLRTAVNGVPGLAAAILANGISIHPYGAVGENKHDDWGTAAVAADESIARDVLGRVPPFYITEFGFDLGSCGRGLGACSPNDQARQMRAAYNVFLADPNILGIWWYQSHDDGTGQWGFMNDNNTTRPSFRTLSSLAQLVGQ